MNEAFVGVWFNIRLCYHKLMTSHMMRPQPFFFVVTLVVVVVGGYIFQAFIKKFIGFSHF